MIRYERVAEGSAWSMSAIDGFHSLKPDVFPAALERLDVNVGTLKQ